MINNDAPPKADEILGAFSEVRPLADDSCPDPLQLKSSLPFSAVLRRFATLSEAMMLVQPQQVEQR